MFCDFPDFQHGFVFEGMKRVRIAPLFERPPFLCGAVDGVQAHAPMRSGIGDRIVFSFG
jgi:hypothetical protein